MATIRPKNDPVRLFGRRLMLLALLVLLVAAVPGAWKAYQEDRESAVLRGQAQTQLNDLSQRQAQLDADIATLQTDRGMEAALRDQYALAAKGENLIIIEDATSAAATAEATSSAFAQWIHKAFPWW
jgi:cell division protein FtsB